MVLARLIASRSDLFPSPIWVIDLDEFIVDLTHMASVARTVLSSHPTDPNDPYRQSRAVLQEVRDVSWRRFFVRLGEYMAGIISTEVRLQSSGDLGKLRSWVLEIKPEDRWRQSATVSRDLHSHLPSTLSSVFYVEVPYSIIGQSTGGTTFRDPNAVITQAFRPATVHVSAVPGRLIIFPSWLEHAPEPPATELLLDSPRLVVSTDLRIDHL